jgi:hypothetical protein
MSARPFAVIRIPWNSTIGAARPVKLTVVGPDMRPTMRLFLDVLARVAITVTCTNSAATSDAHVEPRKSFVCEQPIGAADVESHQISEHYRQMPERPGI